VRRSLAYAVAALLLVDCLTEMVNLPMGRL
jgi:hypothetical protein